MKKYYVLYSGRRNRIFTELDQALSRSTRFRFDIKNLSKIDDITQYHFKPDTVILVDAASKEAVVNLAVSMKHSQYLPVVLLTKGGSVKPGDLSYVDYDRIEKIDLAERIVSEIESFRSQVENKKSNLEFLTHGDKVLDLLLNGKKGIVILDKDKRILFINDSASSILNMQQEQRFGFDPFAESPVEIKESGNRSQYVEFHASEAMWSGKDGYLIIVDDVTKKVYAERRLRESEEKYELAMSSAGDIIVDWFIEKDKVSFSGNISMLLNLKEEACYTLDDWENLTFEEDRSFFRKQIDKLLSGDTDEMNLEYRIKGGGDQVKWVRLKGKQRESDNTGRFTGTLIDITERKEAEINLRSAMKDLQKSLASEQVLLNELDRRNKELTQLSITDGLTNLYNHKFIQERLEYEFKRARRYDTELSCMMIDIDHFKEINDNYGHQFGDTVLEELSQILKNNTREVDICGRYGGEEFLIISTQGEEGAKMHAEKIQKAVRAHRFSDEGDSPKVTVSIGIATMKGKVSTKQDLIAKADKALYQAKDEGRDLIRVWTEEKTNVIEAIDQSSIFELKEQFIGMSKKMKLTYIESTNALLKAVDTKDHYTYQHSKNVANCSEVLARELRLQDENVEIVKNAALLHDIGKIGIEKELLMKEEGLTDKEFEVIKNHPRLGVNILRGVNFLEKEIPIILSHHEWYDGNGYPEGLKGREIPFGAQIISVADAFDAMSTPRNYRKKLSIEKIMQELKEGAGTQFNSEIIEAFFVAYDKGLITTGNGMD